MNTRTYSALPLLLIATGLTWGQIRADTNRGGLPDVDLRAPAIGTAVSPDAPTSALVERRTRNIDAFVAERQATQPGMRIVPSRHGMPKLMVRDGRTLSAAS